MYRHICLYISDLVFLARVNRSWIVHEDSSGKTESFTWMHWPWHLLYLTNRAQSMESRELRRILWQSCPPEGPQFQVIILFTNVRRQRLLIREKMSMIFCKRCAIILSLLLIRQLTCCPRIKWFARLSLVVGPSPNTSLHKTSIAWPMFLARCVHILWWWSRWWSRRERRQRSKSPSSRPPYRPSPPPGQRGRWGKCLPTITNL